MSTNRWYEYNTVILLEYMFFHTLITFFLAFTFSCNTIATTRPPQPANGTRGGLLIPHQSTNIEDANRQRLQARSEYNPTILNLVRHEDHILDSSSPRLELLEGEKSKRPQLSYETQFIQPRILQQLEDIQTSNNFIWGSCVLLKWVMVLGRNTLLFGLFTHSIEVFLPYLILSQSILMLAFWSCQKHYLTTFFATIFNSPFDLLNAMRLIAQPSFQKPNLDKMVQYGFGRWAICSVSGEIITIFLLLVLIALTKNTTLCAKYDWLQRLAGKLRPKINGFIMGVLPRVATLTALHLRDFSHNSAVDTINGITCGLLLVGMGVFFVLLLLQTRRAVASKSEEERRQMGLLSRIDPWRDFDLDCFQWSSLYFPCMSYLKLVVYCVPIGLFWDCNQLSYGAPMAAQFFWVMAETTSRVYLSLTQRIVFPIITFMMIGVQFSLVMVGLAESAPYSPLSESWEIAFLVIVMVLLGVSLGFTGIDCWREFRKRWEDAQERKGGKNDTTHRLAQSHNRKVEDSELDQQKDHQQEKTHQSPCPPKKTNMKIKKAKTGKAFGGFIV